MRTTGFNAKFAAVAALLVIAIATGSFILGRNASPNSAVAASTTGQSSVAHESNTTSRSEVPVTPARSVTSATARRSPVSGGLESILVADLPPEARTTLALIASNGPFPYSRDGVVYSNFEKILPQQPSGYYHEYTVVTPGASNRATRRIITGRNNERFYTADHYVSFREIVGS